MERILTAQEAAGIDIIELGYIDEKDGSAQGRTQYKNERVISQYFLKEKRADTSYVAMIDFGKFNVDNLQDRTKKGIDGIRLAFHKKDYINMIEAGRCIMKKGYQLYIQPMITLRYSDTELIKLIDAVNDELSDAEGFYIVDSFGEMRTNDMNRILHLVDHNLNPSMGIGFHSHNNLQMSYSNAVALLHYSTVRNMILDCSIMGMGKGAGNLNTELLLEHLNLFYGKHYHIMPLLEVIDKVINQLHSEFYWGYAPEYYLSSANHCTPGYASYFYDKHMLPVDQVSELLGLIREDKRISFDKDYAEELYFQYNQGKSMDDEDTVRELKNEFLNKRVLLVAPGKSILAAEDEIRKLAGEKDVLSIGLNVVEKYEFDYVLITRQDIYQQALAAQKNVIVTSNVSKGGRGNVKILNYRNWINIEEETYDSSAVIAFNLIKRWEVKCLFLAGFDGFSVNINDNYYDLNMRRPVHEKQAEKRNQYYRKLISEMADSGITVKFITRSLYENRD